MGVDGGQVQGKEVRGLSVDINSPRRMGQRHLISERIEQPNHVHHFACTCIRSAQNSAKQEEGDPSSPDIAEESPLSAARRLRHRITLEGAPLFYFIGLVEWFLVFIGLATLFTLQYIPALVALHQLAVKYWLLAAGGYTALALGHGEELCFVPSK